MKVSVVIPNWNGREKLARNLPVVFQVPGVEEVIVVDDKSSDDSVSFIKENFPKVKLITKAQNDGFASTVNLGVKNAAGDLVFLLNSDAKPEIDCLSFVLPHFENRRVFSVGCSTGGSWSWARFKKGFFWHQSVGDKISDSHQTLWASGGSGVFRKKVWDELGGLDELFNPFYEEDVDLGYRATKRGYINIFEPKARVEHYKQKGVIEENFSKSKVASVAQRNQLLFIWKNMTDKGLIDKHIKKLVLHLMAHPGYWLIFISALAKLSKIRRKRELEKREAVLSDSEILSKFTI